MVLSVQSRVKGQGRTEAFSGFSEIHQIRFPQGLADVMLMDRAAQRFSISLYGVFESSRHIKIMSIMNNMDSTL